MKYPLYDGNCTKFLMNTVKERKIIVLALKVYILFDIKYV